jgi:hypothetical protein
MIAGDESKGCALAEPRDIAALERQEIATRVASFRATQQKFERAREEYFVTTMKNAGLEKDRHRYLRPPSRS